MCMPVNNRLKLTAHVEKIMRAPNLACALADFFERRWPLTTGVA